LEKLGNCSIGKITCHSNSSSSSECTRYKFDCNNSSSCSVSYTAPLCKSSTSCQQYLNESYCVCPVDISGTYCQYSRQLTCSMDLNTPTPDCSNPYFENTKDPKDYLLDGDRACLVFPLSEPINMNYHLSCYFTDSIAISEEVTAANFSYYVSNSNFSLTYPLIWGIEWKIFNFNRLSDNGQMKKVTLTKDQMTGALPIWFNQTLGEIPDKYWHGNRIYAELSWTDDQKPVVASKYLGRVFLDSTEKKIKTYKTNVTSKNSLAIILGTLLPSLAIIAILVFVFRKRVKSALGYRDDEIES